MIFIVLNTFTFRLVLVMIIPSLCTVQLTVGVNTLKVNVITLLFQDKESESQKQSPFTLINYGLLTEMYQ